MEELQSLLRYYNLSHLDDMEVAPWSKQYCEDEFPRYWQVVYSILEKLDRKLRIIEIGIIKITLGLLSMRVIYF